MDLLNITTALRLRHIRLSRTFGARTEPCVCDETMQGTSLAEGPFPYLQWNQPRIDPLNITRALCPLHISYRADATCLVLIGAFRCRAKLTDSWIGTSTTTDILFRSECCQSQEFFHVPVPAQASRLGCNSPAGFILTLSFLGFGQHAIFCPWCPRCETVVPDPERRGCPL